MPEKKALTLCHKINRMAIRPAVFRHQYMHMMLECCVTFVKLRIQLGLGLGLE